MISQFINKVTSNDFILFLVAAFIPVLILLAVNSLVKLGDDFAYRYYTNPCQGLEWCV